MSAQRTPPVQTLLVMLDDLIDPHRTTFELLSPDDFAKADRNEIIRALTAAIRALGGGVTASGREVRP